MKKTDIAEPEGIKPTIKMIVENLHGLSYADGLVIKDPERAWALSELVIAVNKSLEPYNKLMEKSRAQLQSAPTDQKDETAKTINAVLNEALKKTVEIDIRPLVTREEAMSGQNTRPCDLRALKELGLLKE